ncbi:coiled-coil domain-containing protein [Lactiplantibacillus plantarum]|uniref:hypothetical protein n=1 Tax=Lactiplantibacillus plantarum TaxID=1590 RepID=UPI000FEC40EC|nr:hypothetical protein [Lactiplantibacillus plantarum]MCG0674780.1 hypothetical protein [Lactiplantibacillus plantarum]MCG0862807.1 hypothetical protein [Lactiplantibacillus plantarum]MCG0875404.1 hypothetical protein [Lactiplantibacillus plantarum]QAB22217.1 hypothetical protein EPT60_15780 [Lactiplantibacillus plantarum]QAB24963.1 hypothetical protein EPT59_14750 [Lactiplantibacillus plantarum]
MALFKKRAKLQEPFVLEFSKGDSQKLRHDAVVTELIEELGQQERVARSGIIQQLPLMTLNVACQLFQRLREHVIDQGDPMSFETITVLQRQAAGRGFKYEPYVRVGQFTLDRDYRDFTGAVVNSIFNAPEFADIDYDDKRTWASEFMAAYQAANPDQQVVALVPSETQAEADDFRVRYAGLDEVVQPATRPASEAPAASSATTKNQTTKVAASAGATTSQPTSSGDRTGELKAGSNEPTSQAESSSTAKPEKMPVIPKPSRIGQIKVPQFKVQNLAAVPEADQQYVAYQVEQKKRHSNTYLRTLEQRLNTDATQDLVSYSEQQRQAIAKKLRDYQAQHDTQADLRETIQAQVAQNKAQTEAKVLADLKSKRDVDVQQIQADAERAVTQRQAEYEQQVQATKQDLDTKAVQDANERYASELKARQTALKQQLASLKHELDQQTRADYNRRVGKLVANNQNIAGTVYQNLAKKLDEYALEVTKVHLNAVETQASADRAKFNLVDVQQLEHKLDRVVAEKQNVMQEKEDLQKLLKTQTTELTQLKQQSGQVQPPAASSQLEQLLAAQLATKQQPAPAKSVEREPQPKTLQKVSLGLGTAVGLAVLGGGGLWAYHDHQQVTQALTTNQQQLRQAQSNTASLNRQYYQLSQHNTALKGQVSAAQQDKKTAQAEASQTKAQLTKAQATAKSAAKKTSEK